MTDTAATNRTTRCDCPPCARHTDNRETRIHSRENWVTLAVTALPPGWLNVYVGDDGDTWTEPAIAILIQESSSSVYHCHYPNDPHTIRTQTESHTTERRTVVAKLYERSSDLAAADDDDGQSDPAYRRTVNAEQWAAEHAAATGGDA